MEDYNLLDYNQHQLMKRAPTLITEPSLVFLAPTKKGFRNPILKYKIPLASLMSICYSTIYAHQPLLVNQLIKTVGQALLITLLVFIKESRLPTRSLYVSASNHHQGSIMHIHRGFCIIMYKA